MRLCSRSWSCSLCRMGRLAVSCSCSQLEICTRFTQSVGMSSTSLGMIVAVLAHPVNTRAATMTVSFIADLSKDVWVAADIEFWVVLYDREMASRGQTELDAGENEQGQL